MMPLMPLMSRIQTTNSVCIRDVRGIKSIIFVARYNSYFCRISWVLNGKSKKCLEALPMEPQYILIFSIAYNSNFQEHYGCFLHDF